VDAVGDPEGGGVPPARTLEGMPPAYPLPEIFESELCEKMTVFGALYLGPG